MPTSGWRRPSSVSSGWIVRSSRRAPNQSSTLGSSDPAATTSIAQPSRVAAAPTPTSSVLPAARSRKNADASTISTMPMVKTNRARPRRLRLECRMPGPRHQGQRQQHVEQRQQPRQPPVAGAEVPLEVLLWRHLRLLAGGEEVTKLTTAIDRGNAVLRDRNCANGGRCTLRGHRRDHHAAARRAADQRDLGQPHRNVGPVQHRVDQQRQWLPVQRGHQPEAAQREDHRGAHQGLLVDQGPANAQAGGQSEQTGDHPDDQPNASPSRTWTMEERSDGSRPRR